MVDYDKAERKVDAEDADAARDARREKLPPRKVLRMIDGKMQEPKSATGK